mmetsp:Transcript_16219/g.41144  ORF Transcript_16219/g.41144 Transcript_16219/m.41144 type:complete len:211 (+) Transcript_16219:303-935(+)
MVGNRLECGFDVDVLLGRGLKEVLDAKLSCQLLTLFARHGALRLVHVALVPDEDLTNVVLGVVLDLANPVLDVLETAAVRHIVDQQDALRTPKVGGRDRAEALLAGGVPNLELDDLVTKVDRLDLEVDANSGDERGAERVVRVPQEEASLAHARVANHEQLDLHVKVGIVPVCHGGEGSWRSCTCLEHGGVPEDEELFLSGRQGGPVSVA